MRAWLVLLTVLLMIAPATGQVAAWDDAEGDQTVTYRPFADGEYTQTFPENNGWFPQFDIVRAGVFAETEDTIVLEFAVASEDYQGTEPDVVYVVGYHLYFTYHGESMRLFMYWYQEWSDQPWGYIERLEGEYWQAVTWAEIKAHPELDGWTATIDKWELRDQQLVPARKGDVLGNFWATAARSEYDWNSGLVPSPFGLNFFGIGCTPSPQGFVEEDYDWSSCGVNPEDNAGSASDPLGSYTLTQSPAGLGNILLETERPFRASNGLATTYVYTMRLHNFADEADTISLAATNTPSNWDIYLPPRIEIGPMESKDVRMAVGVPFGHKHGEAASVTILAKSGNDGQSKSDTELVVFWPEIAQPSGHHPRLYLHADGGRHWMNTADTDPDADGTGVAGPNYSRHSLIADDDEGNPQTELARYGWYFYLRPGLFTGLDFEVAKPIVGEIDIATLETMDATVITDLTLYRENQEPIILGTQEQTVSFTGGETKTVEVSMTVPAAADRIPFADNSWLYLDIWVEGFSNDPVAYYADGIGPSFLGTGSMEYNAEIYTTNTYLDLPLLDYHDDVEPGLLDALTRLQLQAPEEIVRPVNPGRTAAYFFEVINNGDAQDTVEWSVEGPKKEWAQVVPGFSKVQQSGGKATVAIRVDVPADAPAKDVADLLLVGQSTKDPEAQVFGQFIAYVETGGDIPDEAGKFELLAGTAEETEAKGAPIPIVVAFAAVALAFAARRRTV